MNSYIKAFMSDSYQLNTKIEISARRYLSGNMTAAEFEVEKAACVAQAMTVWGWKAGANVVTAEVARIRGSHLD